MYIYIYTLLLEKESFKLLKMGNKAPNVKKHQMMELNRAIDSKTTTKIVALLKQYGVENGDVAKIGCQHLFYALGREVS